MLIISALATIWSFEIYLKSQLTNVNGVFLRVTPLGRVFKIYDFFSAWFAEPKILWFIHYNNIPPTTYTINRAIHTRRTPCFAYPFFKPYFCLEINNNTL